MDGQNNTSVGSIPQAQTPVQTPPVNTISPQPTQTPPPPAKSFLSRKIIIIAAIIFIIFIGGTTTYVAFNNQTKPTPTPTPELTQDPTPTSDPTADWKTYTSSNIGFSLRYPKEMDDPGEEYNEYIEGDETTVVVFSIFDPSRNYPPKEDILSISVRSGNLKNKSLAQFVNESITQINKKGLIIQEQPKEVSLDSLKGYLSKAVEEQFSDYYFSSIADKYIEIEILVKDPRNVGYQSIADKILSTFKFTEVGPTPTCIPRPACLDKIPRCLIPETPDMCPAKNSTGSGLTK